LLKAAADGVLPPGENDREDAVILMSKIVFDKISLAHSQIEALDDAISGIAVCQNAMGSNSNG